MFSFVHCSQLAFDFWAKSMNVGQAKMEARHSSAIVWLAGWLAGKLASQQQLVGTVGRLLASQLFGAAAGSSWQQPTSWPAASSFCHQQQQLTVSWPAAPSRWQQLRSQLAAAGSQPAASQQPAGWLASSSFGRCQLWPANTSPGQPAPGTWPAST